MPRSIVYDISNYAVRLFTSTPTGVGRVDMAYGRHFAHDSQHLAAGIRLGMTGPRLQPAVQVRKHLDAVDRRWQERGHGRDAQLASICDWLTGSARPKVVRLKSGDEPQKHVAFFSRSVDAWARSHRGLNIPQGAVYLNIAFARLHRPKFYRWLDARPDVKPVFFLHDLLPIEYPEYFQPDHCRRFEIAFETLKRRAAALIVSNVTIPARFRAAAGASGRDLPIHVAEFPPDVIAPRADPLDAILRGEPYFVICSTIEPRKNHLMLLQIWRALAQSGRRTPKLVIIGSRGWENEQVIDMFDRCHHLADHVLEVSDLSSQVLYRLMAHARGVLMPSFMEGFGLPLIEALSLGAPIVASDIPVFRTVTQGRGRFFSPIDGLRWMEEIERLAFDDAYQAERRRESAGFVPAQWQSYFSGVEDFLQAV